MMEAFQFQHQPNSIYIASNITPQHFDHLTTSLIAQCPQAFPCNYHPLQNASPQDSPCSFSEEGLCDQVMPSFQQVDHKTTSQKSEEAKDRKRRKAKKCSSGETEKKASEEIQTGYIHVRARRGQATDSHSLAERVRREKINERMKKLQGLVPGCDKVVGKAVMLDEIINYVQSLQNQVEFLSMKLASAHTMHDDIGLTIDDYILLNQDELSPQTVQSFPQNSGIQSTTFAETENNYPMLDTPLQFSQYCQQPTSFFHTHVNMEVEEHRPAWI